MELVAYWNRRANEVEVMAQDGEQPVSKGFDKLVVLTGVDHKQEMFTRLRQSLLLMGANVVALPTTVVHFMDEGIRRESHVMADALRAEHEDETEVEVVEQEAPAPTPRAKKEKPAAEPPVDKPEEDSQEDQSQE